MPDEQEAFVQSLVENLERRDLAALEEATAFRYILDREKGLTQESLAKQVGRSPAYLSNALALLSTPEPVKAALTAGTITVAHAKAMKTLPEETQAALVQRVVEKRVSSKDLEHEIADSRERQRQSDAKLEHDTETATALIERFKKDETPVDTMIFVREPAVARMLAEAGFTGATQTGPRRYEKNETVGCDCTAIEISWNGSAPVCVVAEHHEAFTKDRDAAHAATSSLNNKRVEKARRAVAGSLQNEGSLNVDGHRAVLYSLAKAMNGQVAQGIVNHFGGKESLSYREYAPLWQTIENMTSEDVTSEICRLISQSVIINVFGDSARWDVEKDAAFRQFLVDQFGIETDMVRGIHAPKVPVVAAEPVNGVQDLAAALDDIDADDGDETDSGDEVQVPDVESDLLPA
jgi:transcriptional regulator with XRE-family HTH domain